MSNLSAFLHPAVTEVTREVVISPRFQEGGKPLPFKIRSLTQEQNAQLRKSSTRSIKNAGGVYQERLDPDVYSGRLIVAATVFPDFSSAELCEAYGTKDPVAVPAKMLLSGEYTRLIEEINNISGFEDDPDDDAKN